MIRLLPILCVCLAACTAPDSSASAEVTFTDKQGVPRTVLARPGQVVVFGTDLGAAIAQRGGQVVKQDSLSTMLLVSVPAGSEGSFIASLRGVEGLADAFPDQLLDSASSPQQEEGAFRATAAGDVTLLVIDDFMLLGSDSGLSHGRIVETIAGAGLTGTGLHLDEKEVASPDSQGSYDDFQSIEDAILAHQGDRALLINLSRGPHQATKDNFDVNYKQLVGRLWWLVKYKKLSLDNVVVVKSSGNAGIDMTDTLQYLHQVCPEVLGAAPNVLFVGGAGAPDECQVDKSGANYADPNQDNAGQPLMLYAPNRQLTVPGAKPGFLASGTSFAAPRVANRIARALLADPKSTLSAAVRGVVGMGPMLCPDTCLPHVSRCAQAAAGRFTAQLDCPGVSPCSLTDATATIQFQISDCAAEQGGDVTLALSMGGTSGTDHATFDSESCRLSHLLVVPGCANLSGAGTYDLIAVSCAGYTGYCPDTCVSGPACTCGLQKQ